jgi:hypothetical protein
MASMAQVVRPRFVTLYDIHFLFDARSYSIRVGNFLKSDEISCKMIKPDSMYLLLCIAGGAGYYCRAVRDRTSSSSSGAAVTESLV